MIARTAEPDLFETAAAADRAFVAEVAAVPTRLIRGMIRDNASIESQHGAVDVLSKRTKLQQAILAAILYRGPMTRRQVEELPEFRQYAGVSTVQVRITELKAQGMLVQVGRRDKMATWDIATSRQSGQGSTP